MSTRTGRPEPGRVRIPADVDRPDRILAGLTARQLALIAVPAVVAWAGYLAIRRPVPPVVFVAGATPLAVAAVVLATGRRDGVSAHARPRAAGGLPRPHGGDQRPRQ